VIFRILVVGAVAFVASAPAALADTQYGGTGFNAKRASGPSVTLVRHDDGRIDVRLASGYGCGKAYYTNRVVRLSGSTPDGVSFTATGSTRLSGRGKVTYTLTGTLAPDGVTGEIKEGAKNCPRYTLSVALKPESAPAGAPTPAPGNALLGGLTSQAAGAFRLPVSVKVTKDGRFYALWQASMKCGPKAVLPVWNVTPTSKVKPDGTFSRSETYTIRYSDGSRDRYRVNFSGRFLADGATGTLRARMQTRKRGHRYYPCDSGTQTWTAR
jgi:hypothetical protein